MARVIEGLGDTLAALKEFYPDTYKQMNKEIRPVMKGLVRRSQALVPDSISGLSSWMKANPEAKSRTSASRAFPTYDPSVIRKGITYTMGKSRRQRNGWVSMYTLFNRSAAGAIIETAGRVNPAGRPTSHMTGRRKNIEITTSKDSRSNNPLAGVHFINSISLGVGKLYKVGASKKQRGRLIFQAFDQDAGAAQRAVVAAIDKAKAATQDKVNKAH